MVDEGVCDPRVCVSVGIGVCVCTWLPRNCWGCCVYPPHGYVTPQKSVSMGGGDRFEKKYVLVTSGAVHGVTKGKVGGGQGSKPPMRC